MDEDGTRSRPRLIWLVVALVVLAIPVVITFVVQRVNLAPDTRPFPNGELWYCLEPDTAHAAGAVYLLTTHQVHTQVGQTQSWPDRIETGHVGTPLQWGQPAGEVTLALNLDPSGPGDSTVDKKQSATVREGEVTAVLVPGAGGAAPVCPVAPTAMATPLP